MRQPFAKRWKLPALFSLRIMVAVKAYDFGSRKGGLDKNQSVAQSN